MIIADIEVKRISDPSCWGVECGTCGYVLGGAENGLFLGDYAGVDRIRVRDVRAAGIVTNVNTDGSTINDIDIDRIGVGHINLGAGVWLERTTRNTTVEDFCIGPLTRIGVLSEQDHCGLPTGPDGPRGIQNLVSSGVIQSWLFGVAFAQGTVDSAVEDTIFLDYHRAGIVMYRNYSAEPDPMMGTCPGTYDDGGTQSGNLFFEDEGNGVCDFTRSWDADPTPDCE
jgi:hypothetical protein